MKKKFAIILVLMIFCIGLAACTKKDNSADTSKNASNTVSNDASKDTSKDTSGDVSKEDKKDTVVCYSFGVMSGGPAWGQYQKGFYDACAELGWEGHYLCPTTDNDMTQLFNLHETAISNGADVMIPCVTDNEAMSDILDKAVEQGITMVGIGLPDPHIPVLIGTDNINLGRKIAEALVQCMGDKEIHVVTMQTILAHPGQTSQVDAFEERLKELRPDAEIVRREECNSSAQTSQDKLSAICLANPQTNAFVSFDCYAGLGAATYVESEGLKGKFCVIGIDASAENFKAMKDGYMDATVAQMWYEMGYEAVKLANDLRNGKDVPANNDSGAEIIMPDDIDKWAEKLEIELD